MIKRAWKSICNYFLILWLEILKAILPAKKKTITIKELGNELKTKNKNELVHLLTQCVANVERSIPVIDNKREIKQYSKKQIIRAILNIVIGQAEEQGQFKPAQKPAAEQIYDIIKDDKEIKQQIGGSHEQQNI